MNHLTTVASLPSAGGWMTALPAEIARSAQLVPMTPYWAEQLDIPNPAQLRTLATEQKADGK